VGLDRFGRVVDQNWSLSGTSVDDFQYGYDADGNMTAAAGDAFVYDGENRLASVNGTAVQFVYGADGARLKKIAGATTTLYLGADVEKAGSQYTKYLPGDALRQGASTYWLHRDHLSSVRLLTNSSGGAIESGQYRPYGERQGFAGPVTESRGYIGERHDDETGLMYLNARYYDPVLARFVQGDSSDPTKPGVDVNRYAYAGNNPILYLDPIGLEFGTNYERGYEDAWGQPLDAFTPRNYPFDELLRIGFTAGGDRSFAIHETYTVLGPGMDDVFKNDLNAYECHGNCDSFNAELAEQARAQNPWVGASQVGSWRSGGYNATTARVLSEEERESVGAARTPAALKWGYPPELPEFIKGGKTTGVLRTSLGDTPLISARTGPASEMPLGSPGFDAYTRTHVEGHAAAYMRQQGIMEGTLYINNPEICSNCMRNLPFMLPPGANLNVVLPNGIVVPFTGVP